MIVSQQIIEDSPQGANRRRIQYAFTDHLGVVHKQGYFMADDAFDANADILLRVARIEQGLDEQECNSFAGDPMTATFQHTNRRKVLRRLLIEAMRDENPKLLLALEPAIAWIRANYSGAQVANYLNITIPQAVKLSNRFDALVAIASTLGADLPEDIA